MNNKVLKEINGRLVELDNDIADLIVKLNENDYTTQYCCSSHPENGKLNGYIMFSYDNRTLDMLNELLDSLDFKTLVGKLNVELEIRRYNSVVYPKANKVITLKFLIIKEASNYKYVLELFNNINNLIDEEHVFTDDFLEFINDVPDLQTLSVGGFDYYIDLNNRSMVCSVLVNDEIARYLRTKGSINEFFNNKNLEEHTIVESGVFRDKYLMFKIGDVFKMLQVPDSHSYESVVNHYDLDIDYDIKEELCYVEHIAVNFNYLYIHFKCICNNWNKILDILKDDNENT